MFRPSKIQSIVLALALVAAPAFGSGILGQWYDDGTLRAFYSFSRHASGGNQVGGGPLKPLLWDHALDVGHYGDRRDGIVDAGLPLAVLYDQIGPVHLVPSPSRSPHYVDDVGPLGRAGTFSRSSLVQTVQHNHPDYLGAVFGASEEFCLGTVHRESTPRLAGIHYLIGFGETILVSARRGGLYFKAGFLPEAVINQPPGDVVGIYCLTRDGGMATVSMYIDGAVAATSSKPLGAINDNLSSFVIGHAAPSFEWHNLIFEAWLTSRALTPAEIATYSAEARCYYLGECP